MDRTARTAGVDVGGTKVAVALLDGTTLADSLLEPTAVDDPRALLDQISRMVRELGDVSAVGVGVPSVIRIADGKVMSTTNIAAFRDVALRDALTERLGVPVHVDNDGNLATLSEAWDDDLRLLYRSLVGVTVGTGIGSGIVLDGRPLHGSRTSAVELGHLTISADPTDGAPPAGTAPLPTSLEHWASGRALDRLALARGFSDGSAVTDAAQTGDPRAIDALRILGERVGIGIASLITLLEPEVVVVGGGVSRAGELLVGPAREAARRLLLPGLGTDTEIRVAQHGPRAGVRGAALLARIEESTAR
ncbi:ROK family protein [Patulibacter medicamentivorans]|uniref:ROK family protein n=1 Tax=Patulibacter medicamentivorans TaxID=1097667 RepID=UPI00058D062F|nr:ROK family protein [Patulibacter medicamentivorans]